ncbi:hypothetical protein V5799_024536 [Amblyomma americanum]|uniref:Uncharacterized protein n=1 Tax=Amblyomma americanum TaxID=6943 RepID=A0AAQ4ECA3_AMBAM
MSTRSEGFGLRSFFSAPGTRTSRLEDVVRRTKCDQRGGERARTDEEQDVRDGGGRRRLRRGSDAAICRLGRIQERKRRDGIRQQADQRRRNVQISRLQPTQLKAE